MQKRPQPLRRLRRGHPQRRIRFTQKQRRRSIRDAKRQQALWVKSKRRTALASFWAAYYKAWEDYRQGVSRKRPSAKWPLSVRIWF